MRNRCTREGCSFLVHARGECNTHQRQTLGLSRQPGSVVCFTPGCDVPTRGKRCVKHSNENSRYVSKYGVTLEEFMEMVERQGGLCAICLDRAATDLDHNHKTGKIRDVLCRTCNHAIGSARESKRIMLSMIAYIEKHEES